jgi:gingipain R
MKNIFLFLFSIIGFTNIAFAQPALRVLKNDEKSTIVEIKFAANAIKNNDVLQAVFINGCTQWLQKGAPNLPKYSFSLQIPNANDGIISILNATYTSIQNVSVLPSKGKLTRADDVDKIPFEYGTAYQTNQFYPQAIATANQPFIVRDIRGQSIQVSPVQYNPITKEMLAYQSITLEINYSGNSTINILQHAALPSAMNETYFQLYSNQFVNFVGNDNAPNQESISYTPFLENDELLVLCPQKFIAAITPFVEWKKRKGIYTTLVNVDTLTGGISQSTIFNFIKNYYLDFGISHVLMVGNETDIPIMDGGTIYGNGSDNPYGYLAGGDHYAEVIVGRFTGDNAQHITNQVIKSINYEKIPNISNKWFSNCVGVASTQGPGDDAQLDWQHERIICDSLVAQGPFDNKLEFFDGSQGDKDEAGNPSAFTLIDSMNAAGIGCINYTGHGSTGGVVTTQFTSNEVPLLHNSNGKWPFMLVVGCSPGYFLSPSKCFAETLCQSIDSVGGAPIGTVINAMSTVLQWWDAPMEAQDEFNNILCDAREFATKHSFAGMLTNGMFSMNEAYDIPTDPLGGSEMTDTWEIFGDPTLVVKTNDYGAIICTGNLANIPINATSFSVGCNTNGADACLYYKGEILATAKVIAGVANFNFTSAITDTMANVFLTVTKYNHTPFLSTYAIANYPLAITNFDLQNTVSIYPNPATEMIVIESQSNILEVQIISNVGATIKTKTISNSKKVNCNLNTLASGQYIIKIKTAGGDVVKKLVKK